MSVAFLDSAARTAISHVGMDSVLLAVCFGFALRVTLL